MTDLQLPLWFISDRQPPVEPRIHTRAFSETEKAMAYLRGRPSGECRIQLISTAETLLGLVADLHDAAQQLVALDVECDGSGGQRISLAALAALAAKLQKPVTLS